MMQFCRVIGLFLSITLIQSSPLLASLDFDNDGDVGTDSDIEAFFACMAGRCDPNWMSADINGDGESTDDDIEAFFTLLAGGTLPPRNSDIPPIIPGNGFTGTTPAPSPIGNHPSQATARWDVVQYQNFSGDFYVGVLAYHIKGISKVRFSVNGGTWVDVSAPRLNPQTNVEEFTVKLRSSDFAANAAVEVRAIVIPQSGVARVLAGQFNANSAFEGNFSLYLTANPSASLVRYVSTTGSDSAGDGTVSRPFRTMMRAGYSMKQARGNANNGTIYLLPGDYNFGDYIYGMDFSTPSQYLTITPAPGVLKSQVRLTSGTVAGLSTKLVRLLNLTIAHPSGAPIVLSDSSMETHLWIDDCHFIGAGRLVPTYWTGAWSTVSITRSIFENASDGPGGALLIRDTIARRLGSDGFSDANLVVNSRVYDVDPAGSSNIPETNGGFHPDGYQLLGYRATRNTILKGLVVQGEIHNSQGLFLAANHNVFNFVVDNCVFDTSGYVGFSFQAGWVHFEHLYIRNTRFIGAAGWRMNFNYSGSNVVLENTVFSSQPYNLPDPDSPSTLSRNSDGELQSRVTNVIYR